MSTKLASTDTAAILAAPPIPEEGRWIATPADSVETRHAVYREALRQLLKVHGDPKRGSVKARQLEQAFLVGIQSAGHNTAFIQICLASGRSILD